ncbi:MAG: hypothetical protein ACTSPM_09520 [Candidatus Heimdallarchaeota archaeon]
MNWDRIILYNLLITSIILFSLPYCFLPENKAYIQKHSTKRWAIITDKDGNKMEIEPTDNDSWLVISFLNERDHIWLTSLTGKVASYNTTWGYRFVPESIRVTTSGLIKPSVDLSHLPAFEDIANNLQIYDGENVRLVVAYIEAYEIISTIGLTYNAFGFNYYILQVIALSLIGLCFLVIIIFEAKEKRKERKLQQLLLTLN